MLRLFKAPEPAANPAETMRREYEEWLAANVEDEASRQAGLDAFRAVEDAVREDGDCVALFELITKGADYERAVEAADAAGEIRGRNAKIDTERELRHDSDGVPHPGVGGNTYDAPLPDIFRLASGAV